MLECLKPSSCSDPHFISLYPQQPSLNALGCLVGTFWRWIFPGSQQCSRLIYHCMEQIRAILCHTLLPRVHFMCNSSKKHFRSKFGKEEETHRGCSEEKGEQIWCVVGCLGKFVGAHPSGLVQRGSRGQKSRAMHKAPPVSL